MLYYYIIPFYLTGVFLISYTVVRVMLSIFDFFNFFWDWWDKKRRQFPWLFLLEIAIIGAFIYYIVYWELSGAPDPQLYNKYGGGSWFSSILGW
ncbi:MAG: hypothetical protein HQM08_13940 [Candidatus Riflebacteria bacterium]|nr:hypothetical protein [Candidatus Riflebacteria bacterium]